MAGFDVLSASLSENLFLEASAGTGKTFTIEKFVLRLLLEESGPNLEEILVVTFTKAACLELKRRIGKTLENALKDETLSYLTKKKIERSLSLFDEAKIMTIHSFCFFSIFFQ